MSKRTSFTSLLGQKPTSDTSGSNDEDKQSAPPTTVLMHTVTGNPENPRQPEDYTDDDPEFAELKDTMRLVGQLQPVAAISRDVYVRLKPEYAKAVNEADYVVVGGNRRLAAARQLGWTRLDIRVQDRLGDDEGKLDEAVIIENIHRKKIDPIKEAEFLQRMVKKHGSQDEVARRIGKSQMYVSHRLALLKLDDDVKDELKSGAVKPSQVRGLAAKPAEEQRTQVARIKQDAQKPKPKKKPVQNAVLNSEANAGETHEPPTGSGDGVPEPRQASADASPAKKFPYDDGKEAAFYLDQRMDDTQFFAMVDEVSQRAQRRREQAAAAT
ncbi:ParB/RepB/Spo0J family partition protein [Streptomyces sp. NPDC052114]|uniref:ParB/RepB/Spo0J family partition protein n=1 Tax=unclassified Streptomyces TaxID=2593676 RepID=UPI003437B710